MDGLSPTRQESRAFPKSNSSAAEQPHQPCFTLYPETISQQLGYRRGSGEEPHIRGWLQVSPLHVSAMGPCTLLIHSFFIYKKEIIPTEQDYCETYMRQ